MGWILPPSASTYAGDIDFIYYVILAVTGIAFVVVEAGLIWFLIKYRARPGRRAKHVYGSTTAEIVWTAVPAVTVIVLGLMSGRVWAIAKTDIPADALRFEITARQFEWDITHPGTDGTVGSADDVTIRNQLHVPVDTPVAISLRSEDVIHSFFVPAFRVKQDVVPGMTTEVWFEATQTGEFEIACAELCGLGHTTMGARVTVYTADDYQRWLADRAGAGN